MLKGYRTILFNLAMAVIGLAGLKLSPDQVNLWLDLFIPAWAVGGILLRQFTTTPLGRSLAAELTPAAPAADLTAAVAAVSDAAAALAPKA